MDRVRKNVLLVGDVILDEYVRSSALGISAETPTVVGEYIRTDRYVGGAGLVARHLLRLGCNVTLVCLGDSAELGSLLVNSSDAPTSDEIARLRLVMEPGTLVKKTRYFVGEYKLLQLDVRNRVSGCVLKEVLQEQILDGGYDSLVICDNRHGVCDAIDDSVLELSRCCGIRSYLDTQLSQEKTTNAENYNVDVFLLNKKELESVIDHGVYGDVTIHDMQKAEAILQGKVIVKLGSSGCVAFDGHVMHRCPAPQVKAVDTCGAGDAFLAAYVASDGDLNKANCWAAESTKYIGTVVPPARAADECSDNMVFA